MEYCNLRQLLPQSAFATAAVYYKIERNRGEMVLVLYIYSEGHRYDFKKYKKNQIVIGGTLLKKIIRILVIAISNNTNIRNKKIIIIHHQLFSR